MRKQYLNFFNTILNVKSKSKDGLNSRRDITFYCNRPEFQLDPNRENFKFLACYDLNTKRYEKIL